MGLTSLDPGIATLKAWGPTYGDIKNDRCSDLRRFLGPRDSNLKAIGTTTLKASWRPRYGYFKSDGYSDFTRRLGTQV